MDKEMGYGNDYKFIPAASVASGTSIEVLDDLVQYTNQIVNIQIVHQPDSNEFVLIDTGMPKSANKIISFIEQRFGERNRPKAIILTHGHFDHVGSVVDLVDYWDVPVYAHELEIPYLTGKEKYPDADVTVEGGLVAKMSGIFPITPIDLGNHIDTLPSDGTVPYLSNFKWIHTPGHSPGHVSFFREDDRVLIAGDAFVTVKQDSLYKVLTQELELNGPPRYLTTDWEAAKQSVEKLATLHPSIAVTGHGLPISGQSLTEGLQRLVVQFDTIAKPSHGKYLH